MSCPEPPWISGPVDDYDPYFYPYASPEEEAERELLQDLCDLVDAHDGEDLRDAIARQLYDGWDSVRDAIEAINAARHTVPPEELESATAAAHRIQDRLQNWFDKGISEHKATDDCVRELLRAAWFEFKAVREHTDSPLPAAPLAPPNGSRIGRALRTKNLLIEYWKRSAALEQAKNASLQPNLSEWERHEALQNQKTAEHMWKLAEVALKEAGVEP